MSFLLLPGHLAYEVCRPAAFFSTPSAGDLLRAEQNRQGSEYGELIAQYIREGQIVPQEITIALLRNAIKDNMGASGTARVLVDGFPRKMDQAQIFDAEVCPSQFTLFLQCTEEVMLQRLLKRGETSGRADDNAESIKKRFQTFLNTSMPVVDYYSKQGKVVEVSRSWQEVPASRTITPLSHFRLTLSPRLLSAHPQVDSMLPVEEVEKLIQKALLEKGIKPTAASE